ncbi:substrate-binding domain-containing protein [Vibrio sp. CAIM 722]|uniref:Autoinducer 2-binding periplasmic protein LuxP n=1 Tax=Vibrio eleionomae TaxID=2653505 RepID=A0A7X4LQA2_9VIBR|nr:sugar ABC transporter substrate-binding protein [Vibrio eleionomae]MZI95915.1 substrate-binding domain-containing protein [Vibrio eleionomae]
MKKLTKIMGKSIAAGGLLATAMTMPTAVQAAQDKNIILLQPTEECTYCADYKRFFAKDAKAAGLNYEITTSVFDPSNQANQVEQAISKKPDAIVLWPVDVNALIPSMRKIKKAGIPLVISDAMPNEYSKPFWDVYTGGNSEAIGRESAKAMVAAFKAKGYGDKGQIFAITGTPGAPTSLGRMKGFTEELHKLAPGIKVVGKQSGNWDQNVSMTAASSFFTRYGDKVQGVYAVEDLMMAGVIVAAERSGIDPKKLALVGVGCEVTGYNNIKNGKQFATVLSDAYSDAKYAVDAVVKLLDGVKQDKYRYIPNPMITNQNLNECNLVDTKA